ncbi:MULTISPECIES: hypothetical protein [Methylobacterium]|uniref:hypothetical protein n=1 Tax=Methylobacterium TaxID=407 RepID=UPI0008EC5056|nr:MULTISPECIES: hypothetical protein [Methylobacterium]MBZ6416171.1 hypothetical protein [Methylobacterium sp.]MBK3396087.1 hypothetical protein [Methylobacterium ajmalii]MBK3407876.1 hypothetical protein [Methylobacterium ajmalii]MBK3423557.1 hypothetical protein [Methylobacterium ajmalii]SFE25550.1 hypothetical protein SAMN04487844_10215 [Methylobacterium sp. yr596]
MDRHEILNYFEHRRDGAWVCTRPVTLTTARESVAIRLGARFDYGKKVGGIDLAEYLERLGSQFGS